MRKQTEWSSSSTSSNQREPHHHSHIHSLTLSVYFTFQIYLTFLVFHNWKSFCSFVFCCFTRFCSFSRFPSPSLCLSVSLHLLSFSRAVCNRFQILHPDHIQFCFSLHFMSHIRMYITHTHTCMHLCARFIQTDSVCAHLSRCHWFCTTFFLSTYIFSQCSLCANASVFFVYHLNSGWCLKFK